MLIFLTINNSKKTYKRDNSNKEIEEKEELRGTASTMRKSTVTIKRGEIVVETSLLSRIVSRRKSQLTSLKMIKRIEGAKIRKVLQATTKVSRTLITYSHPNQPKLILTTYREISKESRKGCSARPKPIVCKPNQFDELLKQSTNE